MNIGTKIRTIRKEKGLTMKQLATQIGVSEQAIGNYERGIRNVNLTVANQIATTLGVELSELLTLDSQNTHLISNKSKIIEFPDDGITLYSPEINENELTETLISNEISKNLSVIYYFLLQDNKDLNTDILMDILNDPDFKETLLYLKKKYILKNKMKIKNNCKVLKDDKNGN